MVSVIQTSHTADQTIPARNETYLWLQTTPTRRSGEGMGTV